MRRRSSLVFVVPFGLACVLIGMTLGPPATGQPSRERPPVVSPQAVDAQRYQAALGGNSGHLVVIDTATGHCWSRASIVSKDRWHDLGTPVADRE